MDGIIYIVALLNCLHISQICSVKLPGPLVYVVTPSPRPPQGRSAPFYYRSWMKRMDSPQNVTTTTEKIKTPDLIFAEFESNQNNMKSIRKLLENEKIESKATMTTSRPIYVPDDEKSAIGSNHKESELSTEKPKHTDMTDYFAYYNNLYNTGPVYAPPISSSSSEATSTMTTTTELPNNVEDVWHIIDSEKHDKFSGKWEEEDISPEQGSKSHKETSSDNNKENTAELGDNFALTGFDANPGNDGENESRAIRTEQNFRFPYIDLKPFQMKNLKKSEYSNYSNSKKGNNNMLNLDSFTEIKNPVRGEVQDPVISMHQPIDRFNPAQPYLPVYGIKSPQSSTNYASVSAAQPAPPSPPVLSAPAPAPAPARTVANLVPPPLPPTDFDDFPTPKTYESFPPYAPAAPALKPSILSYKPPYMPPYQTPPKPAPDSSENDESPPNPPSVEYRYKVLAPVPTSPPFAPTAAPSQQSKPFHGYSYNKPSMPLDDSPPIMESPSKPDFQGYHYSKPVPPPPLESPTPAYGHHDEPPPSYQPENDYPELIYDKHHGDTKEGDGKEDDNMGMMPPPPPPANDKPDMDGHGPPSDDNHGFPYDFPGDFKFHHDFDFDDHDHYRHHHKTTTTTTTTEMPRVNRYSYYYLGKKLYYLPLYFSVYFIIYVGALIIKAVLRHKIVYPNSWRPNDQTASFFSKRSVEDHLTNENIHEVTGRVTRAIASAAEKYITDKRKEE